MGEDDVICISSDDDESNHISPRKKFHASQDGYVKKDTALPSVKHRDLKRKVMSTSIVNPKKPKIKERNVIEEITIVSPCKEKIDKTPNEWNENLDVQKIDSLRHFEHKTAGSIETVSAKCPSDSSHSSRHLDPTNRSHISNFNHRPPSSVLINRKLKESRSLSRKTSSDFTKTYCSKESTNVKMSEISKVKDDKSLLPNEKVLSKNHTLKTTLSMRKFDTELNTENEESPANKRTIPTEANFSEIARVQKSSKLDVPEIIHKIHNKSKNSYERTDYLPLDFGISTPLETGTLNTRETPKANREKLIIDEKLYKDSRSSTKVKDGPVNLQLSDLPSYTLQKNGTPKSKSPKDFINDSSEPLDSQACTVASESSKNSKVTDSSKIESVIDTFDKTPTTNRDIFSNSNDSRTIVEHLKSSEVEITDGIEREKSFGNRILKISKAVSTIPSKSINDHNLNESSRKSKTSASKFPVKTQVFDNLVSSSKNMEKHEKHFQTFNNSDASPNSKTIQSISKTIEAKETSEKRRVVKSKFERSKVIQEDLIIKRIIPNKIKSSTTPKPDIPSTKLRDELEDSHVSSISKNKMSTKFQVVQKNSNRSSKSEDDVRSKLPVVKDNVAESLKSKHLVMQHDFHKSSRFKDSKVRNVSVVENDHNNSLKSGEGAPSKSILKPTPGCFDMSVTTENNMSESSTDSCQKPSLIEKTRKPVIPVEQDTFAMFLSLCLQTDRGLEMGKVVAKLKRHYEQLDPVYARSRSFEDLLNKKRDRIMTKGRVYYYIGQVIDEMKFRRKRIVQEKLEIRDSCDNNTIRDIAVDTDQVENDNVEGRDESRRHKLKIKTIEKAMKQCAKRIRELETAEVDFDDENNSHYIKLDRYKEKMVELYAKMCEYTNEHVDAGRDYLRPKNLRVTQIPSIDKAINSFINSKFSYSCKKTKKTGSFIDGLVFPDYIDILECVAKVNEDENLGYDKRKQQLLAQSAFIKLGKHLQNARQKDYWDTFAFDLENSDDPAITDPALAEKLLENKEVADKKTKEIFEEYVRKQEEGHVESCESGSGESEGHNDRGEDQNDNGTDDEECNEKKSNRAVETDTGDFDDEKHIRNIKKNSTRDLETLSEITSRLGSTNENVESKIPEFAFRNEQSNNTGNLRTTTNDEVVSLVNATKNSVDGTSFDIKDNTEEVIKDPVEDQQRPLRIRSFAKPPSSWASSQDIVAAETNRETVGLRPQVSNNTETIDVLDEERNDATPTNQSMGDRTRITKNLGAAVQTDNTIPVVRLPNGNCRVRPNISIFPAKVQTQERPANDSNAMTNRIPTPGAVQHTLRPLQILPRGQVRLQITTAPQTGKPAIAQVLRLQNARVIKASAAVIRPLSTLQSQQLRDASSVRSMDTITGTLNPQVSRTTILHNPRFVRVPGAAVAAVAVAAAARSPEIPQLRMEKNENATQESQGLSNIRNISLTTATQGTLTSRSPIHVLQTGINCTRSIATTSGVKSAGQKTWWLPPDTNPPCKK